MSFPSGQSSLTMYAMLYLAVSAHVRSVSNDSLRSCFISAFYMSSLGKDFPTGFAPGIPSLPHRYPSRFPRTPLGFPAGNLSGIFEEVSSFTQQHWGEKNSRHTGSSTKSCFQKFLLKFINFSPSLQAKSCVHLNYGWWIELKTVLTMKRERRGAKQAGK